MLNNINAHVRRYYLSFRLILIPFIGVYAIFLIASKTFGEQSIWTQALIPALITAAISWRNSVVLENRSFVMSENSRAKEYITQSIDDLFNELDNKLHDRNFLKNLEQYLADKVTLLELRIEHIKKRTTVQLLAPSTLMKLRELPIDMANKDNYQSLLNNLRFEILEELEKSYSKFFDEENLK